MAGDSAPCESLLTSLCAAERYLGVLAALNLPFEQFFRMEHDAAARSRAALAQMGLADRALPTDEATDELLSEALQSPAAMEPLDVGPEGALADEYRTPPPAPTSAAKAQPASPKAAPPKPAPPKAAPPKAPSPQPAAPKPAAPKPAVQAAKAENVPVEKPAPQPAQRPPARVEAKTPAASPTTGSVKVAIPRSDDVGGGLELVLDESQEGHGTGEPVAELDLSAVDLLGGVEDVSDEDTAISEGMVSFEDDFSFSEESGDEPSVDEVVIRRAVEAATSSEDEPTTARPTSRRVAPPPPPKPVPKPKAALPEPEVPEADAEEPAPAAPVAPKPKIAPKPALKVAPKSAPPPDVEEPAEAEDDATDKGAAPRQVRPPPKPGRESALYGSPVARFKAEPEAARPRAAAVRLGAAPGAPAQVVGHEDEEVPIEIDEGEAAEEAEDSDAPGGLVLELAEDGEYEELDEISDAEPVPDEQGDAYERANRFEPVFANVDDAEVKRLEAEAAKARTDGNFNGAVDLYSALIDMADNVTYYLERGRLYLDFGDYTRAMSDFLRAQDLGPEDVEPAVAIGELYFARKDYGTAIEYLDAVLESKPDHAMALCRRGISHLYRKAYKKSLDDLKKASQLDPDIPNLSTYIAMAKKKAW